MSDEIVDLEITKTPSCNYAVLGGRICYTIIATNNGDVDAIDILFSDEIPAGTTYVVGSFEVDGVPQTPMMANNTLQYPIDILAGGSVTIKFCVKVSA